MKQILAALGTGLLFGLGLIVSGMTNPAKVSGFLDLFGNFDPSLAFVMGGAIAVGLLAFRLAARRPVSVLGEPMRLPAARDVDRRLVLGSLTFGVGWGIGGYCPGPGVTSLATGMQEPVIFVAAMLAGMGLFELFERRQAGAQANLKA